MMHFFLLCGKLLPIGSATIATTMLYAVLKTKDHNIFSIEPMSIGPIRISFSEFHVIISIYVVAWWRILIRELHHNWIDNGINHLT